MPNFRKLLSSEFLAAEDFVDGDFNPREIKLVISDVTLEKPPAGGKPKACFAFEKTDKRAFLSNGEVKKIARLLRKANTEDWRGATLTITSGPKKFAGRDTTGMIVTEATLPIRGAADAT